MIFLMLCRIIASLAPKPGPGQRQQHPRNAALSASTSEHTGQKVIRQTQRNREDVDCEENIVGRGEASMETDGEYSNEEISSD